MSLSSYYEEEMKRFNMRILTFILSYVIFMLVLLLLTLFRFWFIVPFILSIVIGEYLMYSLMYVVKWRQLKNKNRYKLSGIKWYMLKHFFGEISV